MDDSDHHLKTLIIDLLDAVTDAELLDLVYKVLLESMPAPQERGERLAG